VLLETFVELGRYRGTFYQAANWIRLGVTRGEGRMGPTARRGERLCGIPWSRTFDLFYRGGAMSQPNRDEEKS